MFIDSHAHISQEPLCNSVAHVIKRAHIAEVDNIINVCTDRQSLERGLHLAKRYPEVALSGAITPHDADKEGSLLFSLFAKAAREKKLVAIGETGLDYYYYEATKEAQLFYLEKHFALARETGLPVILHCREAFPDLFEAASKWYDCGKAVLHCFTGSVPEAEEALKRGWYISFSGIITFKKSHALREVVKAIPPDKILIETDSPYLAPEAYRGQTNEPAFVVEVAREIGKIWQQDAGMVGKITAENARRFFALD